SKFEQELRSLAAAQNPKGELAFLFILPGHSLFPDQKTERSAYEFVTQVALLVRIYKQPIQFAENPSLMWNSNQTGADIAMNFYPPGSNDARPGNGNRGVVRYEFGREGIEINHEGVFDPLALQKRTARIGSLADLRNSQVFLAAQALYSDSTNI